jgi:hypothetical protein
MAKHKIKVELTYAEIDALLKTAGQMEDDLSYYNFIPQPYRRILLQGYGTAREKLASAKQQLHRPRSADKGYKTPERFKNQEGD